jgi:hypothetical protein
VIKATLTADTLDHIHKKIGDMRNICMLLKKKRGVRHQHLYGDISGEF